MIALLSLGVWVYLFFGHGGFWRSRPQLLPAAPAEFPDVDIIVPARDESETIAAAVAAYQASLQTGRPLSERKLAGMFGKTSRRWARSRMAEARHSPSPVPA